LLAPASQRLAFNPTAYANGNGKSLLICYDQSRKCTLSSKSFCHLLLVCLAGSTLNPAQGNPSFAANANTFATTSQNATNNITRSLWYPAPNLTPAPQRLPFNPTAYANENGKSLLICYDQSRKCTLSSKSFLSSFVHLFSGVNSQPGPRESFVCSQYQHLCNHISKCDQYHPGPVVSCAESHPGSTETSF